MRGRGLHRAALLPVAVRSTASSVCLPAAGAFRERPPASGPSHWASVFFWPMCSSPHPLAECN